MTDDSASDAGADAGAAIDHETAWIDSLRVNTAEVRAADPKFRRFGAARHRYACRPPLGDDGVRALEQRLGCTLPFDLRTFVARFSSGGIGPFYGMLPIERAPVIAAPAGAPWTRALAIVDAGCGYTLVVLLDGELVGQIWMYAPGTDDEYHGVTGSFSALFSGWMVFVLRGEWLPEAAPEGQCALPNALSSYLGAVEARLGLPSGALAGDELREALEALDAGAIEIGVDDSPIFDAGDRADPCQTCAQLIDALADNGLRRDVVAPGALPIPAR